MTVIDLLKVIDTIAKGCTEFFDTLVERIPSIKNALDKTGNISEAEIAEAQSDLDEVKNGLERALTQFALINPYIKSPIEQPQPDAPTPPTEEVIEPELPQVDLPLESIENDEIGLPGVSSLDFT